MGQARFERRPTIVQSLEIMVGRRGEAPLVPPYILPSFKKAMAWRIEFASGETETWNIDSARCRKGIESQERER